MLSTSICSCPIRCCMAVRRSRTRLYRSTTNSNSRSSSRRRCSASSRSEREGAAIDAVRPDAARHAVSPAASSVRRSRLWPVGRDKCVTLLHLLLALNCLPLPAGGSGAHRHSNRPGRPPPGFAGLPCFSIHRLRRSPGLARPRSMRFKPRRTRAELKGVTRAIPGQRST